MVKQSVSCIFCEDIRHEMGGKVSLMGCFTKAVSIPTVPFTMSKLCVHTTILIEQDNDIEDASLQLLLNGEAKAEYSFGKDEIQNAQPNPAAAPTHFIAGLQIPNFLIDQTGEIDLILKINGSPIKAGSLKIVTPKATDTSQPRLPEIKKPKKPPKKPRSK